MNRLSSLSKERGNLMYRQIGNSDLRVTAVGLGAMPLSIAGRPSDDDAVRVLHAAFDVGVTLIDTADAYCLNDSETGHNERLIARALETWSRPENIVVATKGGCIRPAGVWAVNGQPDYLRRACENSLRALGVEAIDLYQWHAPDPSAVFTDSVGALARLQDEGKIRYIGLSNVDVDQIREAQTIVQVTSVQNRCNPFDRKSFENGVVEYCTRHKISFLPHSPVGGHRGVGRTSDDSTLAQIGQRLGMSPHEVCLTWLLQHSPSILPIPGASRAQSIQSSFSALERRLDEAALDTMARVFPTARVA